MFPFSKTTAIPRAGAGSLSYYFASLVAVAVTLTLVGVTQMLFGSFTSVVLLYLVPITLAATRWGMGPAILAAVVSVIGHNVLFVEPVGTLTIARPDEAVGLTLLLFTAVVTAQLADGARRSAEKTREAEIARRSDQFKTILLRMVSHDLRTPLASIKASVSALRQTDVEYSPEDQSELLAAVEEETDRLDRLVGNLLDASRLEAGGIVTRQQPQDLGELVHAVVDHSKALLAHHPIKVTIPEAMPLVPCDYAQIDRVLSNLLENAARHTPPETSITVTASVANDHVVVEVLDQGPGIPVAERERLFRPFERGESNAPGSGLGLTIAKGLVEAHGGRMWINDMEGKGTRVSFTLPYRKALL